MNSGRIPQQLQGWPTNTKPQVRVSPSGQGIQFHNKHTHHCWDIFAATQSAACSIPGALPTPPLPGEGEYEVCVVLNLAPTQDTQTGHQAAPEWQSFGPLLHTTSAATQYRTIPRQAATTPAYSCVPTQQPRANPCRQGVLTQQTIQRQPPPTGRNRPRVSTATDRDASACSRSPPARSCQHTCVCVRCVSFRHQHPPHTGLSAHMRARRVISFGHQHPPQQHRKPRDT